MEKKTFSFTDVEQASVLYLGKTIEVIPYLSQDEMLTLAHAYMTDLSSKADTIGGNILLAEFSLMLNIVDLKTNIRVMNEDGDGLSLTIDQLLANIALYDLVVGQIKNYYLFREYLNKIVESANFQKQIESNVGTAINKVSEAVSQILSFEPSEENFNRIRAFLTELQGSPVLDAVKTFKTNPVVENAPRGRKKNK